MNRRINHIYKSKALRLVVAILVILSILLGGFSFPANAEGEWDDSIYRVYVSKEQLSQAQIDSLDEDCCNFVEKWQMDIVLMITDSEDYDGDLTESALDFYDYNGFGYGENKDGIICAYDEDTKEVAIATVGRGTEVFPQSFIDDEESFVALFFDDHSYFGVVYAFYLEAEDYMVKNYGTGEETEDASAANEETSEEQKSIEEDVAEESATEETTEETTEDATEAASDDTTERDKASLPIDPSFDFKERDEYGLPIRDHEEGKPSWYAKDGQSFKHYNDTEIPRVVDIADIFTDEEEADITEKVDSIRAEIDKDIVIFTDNQTYGVDWELYCYDFYDYCGYGIGDTHDGMILFINMDPNNRGWVADSTGSNEDLYTEDFANAMDDNLYPYMADGKYAEGALSWIDSAYNLLTRGMPFIPEWLPEDTDSFVRTNDADASRIVDEANLLNDGEESRLKEEIKKISDEYGIDVLIHTTTTTYGMDKTDYADTFYKYNCYGLGKNFDGIMLTIIKGEEANKTEVTAYGKVASLLTERNYDRLYEKTHSKIAYEHYIESSDIFLKNVAHLEKTGRINMTTFSWVGRVLFAMLCGLIFAGIALARAKAKMVTVSAAYGADKYLAGPHNVIAVSDVKISESTSRKKVQRSSYSDRSSSGSSGGSHYVSHASSSSGRSHTSSSRHF
ncbi:MAG: TPM domain-containing protein [Eubacterium sp.]|nr:TPM domain-containing protein [Eubacterium sp.]